MYRRVSHSFQSIACHFRPYLAYCNVHFNSVRRKTSGRGKPTSVIEAVNLPLSMTRARIARVFKDIKLKGDQNGIKFMFKPNGFASGRALLRCENENDAHFLLHSYACHTLPNGRVIYARPSTLVEYYHMDHPHYRQEGPVLILRSTHSKAQVEDILSFFRGIPVVPNGVRILKDRLGLSIGCAQVQFDSIESADRACELEGQSVLPLAEPCPVSIIRTNFTRMTELVWETTAELQGFHGARPTVADSTGEVSSRDDSRPTFSVMVGTKNRDMTKDDILRFFHPLKPLTVSPSSPGQFKASFATFQDMQAAVKKNKDYFKNWIIIVNPLYRSKLPFLS